MGILKRGSKMEKDLAETINLILSGRTIDCMVDKWQVTGLHCGISALYMTYQPQNSENSKYVRREGNYIISEGEEFAKYSFKHYADGKDLYFENYHREASKGFGTPSLKVVEGALEKLARLRDSRVSILFLPAGQNDTKRWLEKNSYEFVNQGEDSFYLKVIQ